MAASPSDPLVLEIRELARLIALAREWVLRGPTARVRPRAHRFAPPVAEPASPPAARVA